MTVQTLEKRYTPGPVSEGLFEEEQRYFTPGLQTVSLYSKIALKQGRGPVIEDEDGNTYIDLLAGIGVASIGHAHPEYVKAMSEQLGRITVGSQTTRLRLDFAKRLASVTPKGLDRVQLYSSGAEAVEAAFRLAQSHTKKFEFVGFWGGFHGKTAGVLPLLADESFKVGLGPLMPGRYSSPYPNPYRCPLGTKGEHDCVGHCLEHLRSVIKKTTTGALAGIIAEPIQGTAGNVVPPAGWTAGLRRVADEFGALWISDEMITGFGRTGRWFGCMHDEATPDILTIGKGMGGGFPVSGLVTTSAIAQAKPFANPSGSSSSYGGNPLAGAACSTTLRIIQEENLVENSRKVGEAMLKRLKALQDRFEIIGDVRGRGLMIGVEFVKDRKTKEPLGKDVCRALFEEGLRRGVLAMSYSPCLRINPPLNITAEQAQDGLSRFEEALEAVVKRFKL
ncbi:MAG: aspartate aminotransferase family protein [Elusimicrobia bacterium]|nr:aspartate aminotransferase family protein [Elusimicrobiota bacterium]